RGGWMKGLRGEKKKRARRGPLGRQEVGGIKAAPLKRQIWRARPTSRCARSVAKATPKYANLSPDRAFISAIVASTFAKVSSTKSSTRMRDVNHRTFACRNRPKSGALSINT